MKRTRLALLGALTLVVSVTGWAQAAPIAAVKIIGGGTDQIYPSANADWIAWDNNSVAHPTHYDAYVRSLVGGVPTGASTKLNGGNSFGWDPDLLAGGSEVAFQQASGTRSDIYVADLDVVPLHKVRPPGLDTDRWEWRPLVTDSWILFGRTTRSHRGVFLYNRSTHVVRTLVNTPIAKNGYPFLTPSDITETYATWTRCAATCNIYYYDLNAHTTAQVPNPNKTFFYESSLSDATGNIYFVRSGNGCGAAVKIFSWHIGDAPVYTTVASLPARTDAYGKTSVFNDGTHDNLYYNQVHCGGRYYADIYEVPAADTA